MRSQRPGWLPRHPPSVVSAYLWLMGRQWVDLVLWVPDLNHMTIRRITRDENAIEALEADLMAFAQMVKTYETKLRTALAQQEEAAEAA